MQTLHILSINTSSFIASGIPFWEFVRLEAPVCFLSLVLIVCIEVESDMGFQQRHVITENEKWFQN